MSSDVIYHTSDETGAPVLTSANGTLTSVLDACLVNGFNAKSVISLTVAGGVATASISAHGYKAGRKILVAGAGTTAANGVKKVLTASSNSLTFDATGIADGTISGTITSKSAPLGWSKLFGDASSGIYKRKDVTARAALLRVLDQGSSGSTGSANYAAVGMVDSATDMATFTNLVPTKSLGYGYNADGGLWSKVGSNGGTTRWALVGDGTSFYVFFDLAGSTVSYVTFAYGFGDAKAYRSDDTTASFVMADAIAQSSYFVHMNNSAVSVSDTPHSAFLSHSFDGTGNSTPFFYPLFMSGFRIGGSDSAQFPSPYDNGVAVVQDLPIFENNYLRPVARGSLPGLAVPFSPVAYATNNGVIIQGAAGSGKEYYATMADCVGGNTTAASTNLLLDVTGPWQ